MSQSNPPYDKATPPLDYAAAGVNIDAGNQLVEKIKSSVKRTTRAEVLGNLGGFAGLFAIPPNRYQEPVMVTGTDGVGTKLKLAQSLDRHQTIGIDLVAMCVNDILVQGAEPVLFLDYFATGQLSVDTAAAVIEGIAEGCHQAGAALIGGETAEMPGMYALGEYDLAGFTVGLVERNQIIDGSQVQAGDHLIGLASSGLHSNGYSLVRKILEINDESLAQPFGDHTLGEELLLPTRIYVRTVLALLGKFPVRGMAHITGGGILENLPRTLPDGLGARIDTNSWPTPEIFTWLQNKGGIMDEEMYRTFNQGIGMILCVSQEDSPEMIQFLQQQGEQAFLIGEVITEATSAVELTAN